MSLALPRRGHDPQAANDDALRTMQAEIDDAQRKRAQTEQAFDDLGVRCDRLEERNKGLRDDLRAAERDAFDAQEQLDTLIRWCLPMLIPGAYAADPMPGDAGVSDDPAVRGLRGSWRPVPGDRYDLPALIETRDDETAVTA